jgi:hypothetical protein
VPLHERVRSHDDEERSPVDRPREHDEGDSGTIVQAPRPDLPLDIERQLLAKEEVFGCETAVRGAGQRHEVDQITKKKEHGHESSVPVEE